MNGETTMSYRLKMCSLISLCLFCVTAQGIESLTFKKQQLSDSAYESACAADLNNDGELDIVCGEYWFEGPSFRNKHKMCELITERDYYDDFGCVSHGC